MHTSYKSQTKPINCTTDNRKITYKHIYAYTYVHRWQCWVCAIEQCADTSLGMNSSLYLSITWFTLFTGSQQWVERCSKQKNENLATWCTPVSVCVTIRSSRKYSNPFQIPLKTTNLLPHPTTQEIQ